MYVKLFASILHSTVWQTALHVRVAWITLLALANRDGDCFLSATGLAKEAGISLEQCKDALNVLSSPEDADILRADDGRRIELFPAEGRIRLINYAKYRDIRTADERREYKARWMRADREKKRVDNVDDKRPRGRARTRVYNVDPSYSYSDADTDPSTKRITQKSTVCGGEPLRDSPQSVSSSSEIRFPVTGPKGPEWEAPRELLDATAAAFPDVDVEAEWRKAGVWLIGHHDRLKTPRGMPRFLTAWIARSVDRGTFVRRNGNGRGAKSRDWSSGPAWIQRVGRLVYTERVGVPDEWAAALGEWSAGHDVSPPKDLEEGA